ncbi:MAG TPA: GrpB family protein [Acidimicrobiales bacterium]|nr:GrpB family protein [Acidimicrobiales bacterium]
MTEPIVVADYDASWPASFERIAASVWPAVAEVALRIEHVGSTAVPGLAAKPIIDADVVVASEGDVATVIASLAELGYRWEGDLGVVGREAFRAPEGAGLPPHHLYSVIEDGRAYADHWLLRDLLRDDPAACERYAALKRRNAAIAVADLDRYVALKAAFVAELLTRARQQRHLAPVAYWLPDGDGRASPTSATRVDP